MPPVAACAASFAAVAAYGRWLIVLGGVLLNGHWPDSRSVCHRPDGHVGVLVGFALLAV